MVSWIPTAPEAPSPHGKATGKPILLGTPATPPDPPSPWHEVLSPGSRSVPAAAGARPVARRFGASRPLPPDSRAFLHVEPVKKVVGEDRWRIRVEDARLVVLVVRVGHRGDIYRTR